MSVSATANPVFDDELDEGLRSLSRTGRESVASLGRRTPTMQDEGVVPSAPPMDPADLLALQNDLERCDFSLPRYRKMRKALLWLLALDGLFSVTWILVLIYAYNFADYWRQSFEGGVLGGLFQADAIGDLVTISLGRFLGFYPLIYYGKGKWLLITALKWLVAGVLGLTLLWVPFKGAFFFRLTAFEQDTDQRAAWVAVITLVFAAVFPLIEGILYKYVVFDGKPYLMLETGHLPDTAEFDATAAAVAAAAAGGAGGRTSPKLRRADESTSLLGATDGALQADRASASDKESYRKLASGRKSPLATKNLLEDTDGLRRPP